MTYDKNYYQSKRQQLTEKFQKAQQKYFQMCEMAGREYVALQERIIELNQELAKINEEEQKSKEQTEVEKDKK